MEALPPLTIEEQLELDKAEESMLKNTKINNPGFMELVGSGLLLILYLPLMPLFLLCWLVGWIHYRIAKRMVGE